MAIMDLFNKNKRTMRKLDRLMKKMASEEIYNEYLEQRKVM